MLTINEALTTPVFTRAEYARLQKSNQIHHLLSNLVLRGCGLNDLAKKFSQILQRSITIEDPNGHLLANWQYGWIDKAQARCIQLGRRSSNVVKLFFEKGIYSQFSHKIDPVYVPPIPDIHMEMDRITAPIIVDHKICGYIWIIAGEYPFTELDELVIRHGATIAALMMFKEQVKQEADEAYRGDFFEQLLKGPPYTGMLLEQARQLDYCFNRPHRILLLSGEFVTVDRNYPLSTIVSKWLSLQDYNALIVSSYEGLVLIVEDNTLSAVKEIAYSMIIALSGPDQRLLIGLGRVYDSESMSIERSYKQACEAVAIGKQLGQEEGVVVFEELGILHWLYHLSPEVQAQNIYTKQVEILVNYDADRKTELVKTLNIYLDHGCSLSRSAKALNIHRNTLLHRVHRIEQLCELIIRNPHHRFNLHAAVKNYMLHKKDSTNSRDEASNQLESSHASHSL